MRDKLPNEKHKGYLPDSLLEKSEKAVAFIEKNYKDKVTGLWMFTDNEDASDDTDFIIETSIGRGEEYTRLDGGLSLACGGSTLWNADDRFYEQSPFSGCKEAFEKGRFADICVTGSLIRLV
jgi:hypothetical protein